MLDHLQCNYRIVSSVARRAPLLFIHIYSWWISLLPPPPIVSLGPNVTRFYCSHASRPEIMSSPVFGLCNKGTEKELASCVTIIFWKMEDLSTWCINVNKERKCWIISNAIIEVLARLPEHLSYLHICSWWISLMF